MGDQDATARGREYRVMGPRCSQATVPWLPRVGYSGTPGRLTGVGIEHNARALITCIALGILPPALAPIAQRLSAVIIIILSSHSLFFLQSLSGHV